MYKNILGDMKAISFKFDANCTPDCMYIKEHSPRNNDASKPLGRTLFVARVPLYLEENDIKKLFSAVGPIVSVNLQKNKSNSYEDEAYFMKGLQCAFIIYKSRESLVKALNLDELKTLTDENYSPLRGLQKYVKKYNDSICSHAVLLKEAKKAIKMQEKIEALLSKNNDTVEDSCTLMMLKSKNSDSIGKPITKEKKQHKNSKTCFRHKTLNMENSTVPKRKKRDILGKKDHSTQFSERL
ncbi:uncharacterized protein LOC123317836 [Coccinella septempunctata]|uniref:uncharacterized protein LOC123317836 n=1 Tax=Coccinella septempunctata TaxID=41139 RepID=UPI001D0883D6|nr:uncharacterized protein LOC123317836 [Coccinella septempunctata]